MLILVSDLLLLNVGVWSKLELGQDISKLKFGLYFEAEVAMVNVWSLFDTMVYGVW